MPLGHPKEQRELYSEINAKNCYYSSVVLEAQRTVSECPDMVVTTKINVLTCISHYVKCDWLLNIAGQVILTGDVV